MKLYDFPLSGNAYKARLMLALAGIDYHSQVVNLGAGEQRSADFLKLNPAGQVPVLQDGDTVVAGSRGILEYLAGRYAPEYLPEDTAERAQVVEWLCFVAARIDPGLSTARLIKLFNAERDYAAAEAVALASLLELEERLCGREWLVGAAPSIADIAVYPYVRHAEDGDIALDAHQYPNVCAWLLRLESLPGYVAMAA